MYSNGETISECLIVIIILTSPMAISFTSVHLLSYFFISFKGFCDADQCRQLEFTPEKAFDGKRLINHVIRIVEVLTMSFCDNICYMEPDCVSINVNKRVSSHGRYKCELNNVTHGRHEHDLEKKDDYFYHAAEVGVASLANTHFK